MANFRRKRRGPAGPNKNEEKVIRVRQEAMRARGTGLSDRFPTVQHVTLRLEYLGREKQSLGSETRNFNPGDPCDFSAPCPGSCGVGSFDLAAKIESVVLARQSVVETSGVCQQPLYAGLSDKCGCEFKCRIELAYKPEKEPAPAPASAPVPDAAPTSGPAPTPTQAP